MQDARILIYSHDSFGLGHLRRCRAIAHALVERYKGLSILILSGSPIIGSFDFGARVDFVRIPGIIKLRNGEYTSLSLHIDTHQTLDMRASIISHTARIFDPDMLIMDKEPLGLRGEVTETLNDLKKRGTHLVLGLRDVLDDPDGLVPEWKGKNVLPALDGLYDEIWIYGAPEICDPLEGLDLPATVRKKVAYTGYLRRSVPLAPPRSAMPEIPEAPYILVTPGGGGDGGPLIDWVLSAYESDADIPYGAMIVFGPFMAPELQSDFRRRGARLDRVTTLTFDSHVEVLMANAAGIVSMGGYNTFCEIMSFNKPAIIVPRVVPRREQALRATRAEALGLVRTLDEARCVDPDVMAAAIRGFSEQQPPAQAMPPGLLDGLPDICEKVGRILGSRARTKTPPARQRA
ncbi:MAG: hypothetical protein GY791_00105 [Alphaproteobacteria bacterium]|nr:hypothetical protein [Alphaproteobacteria bacterium]